MDHVGFDVWNPLPGKTWATWDWNKSCYTHVADHLPASWKLTFSYHLILEDALQKNSDLWQRIATNHLGSCHST